MKNFKKVLAAALAALMIVATAAFAGCGEDEKGTYTKVIASHDYYAVQEVKDYMAENNGKYVATDTLFTLLNSDIADAEGNIKTSDGVADYYTVKLELKDGNLYTLTKTFKMGADAEAKTQLSEEQKAEIRLEFGGSYTAEKDTVTLKAPDTLNGNFVVAGAGVAYTHFATNCEDINLTKSDMDDLVYPGRFFYYFNGAYFTVSDKCEDMVVTLDRSNKDAPTLNFA